MAVENEPLNGSAKPPGGEAGGAADRPPRTRKLTLANLAHRMIEARVKEVPRTVDKVSRLARSTGGLNHLIQHQMEDEALSSIDKITEGVALEV